MHTDFKSGFASIVGPPNSGKSTLLNAICLKKLSAVSSKPHTTRQHIKGIITSEKYQIVFVDTPGFIKPNTRLEKIMQFETRRAAKDDADVLIVAIEPDIENIKKNLEILKTYTSFKKEMIITITKIDIYSKKQIENARKEISNIIPAQDIIEVSALKNINLDNFLNMVVQKLPFSPPYYPDDILSDKWERYFAGQLIQETVFELYEDEIPYSVAVSVEVFKEDSNPLYILAYIYTSRKNHKMIIIGKEGRMIKKLTEISQKKISDFLSKDVRLELYVKIKENWQDDKKFIERVMGYYN